MNKAENKKQMLEGMRDKLREIEFWRAEYFKRKFMLDPCYEQVKDQYFSVLRWLQLSNDPKLAQFYKDNEENTEEIFRELQHYFYSCKICLLDQENISPNIKEAMKLFFNDKKNIDIFTTFATVSENYCYFVSDLLQPTEMSFILENLEKPLPDPPFYHVNRYGHQELDPQVLSTFYFDHTQKSVIEFKMQSETSIWDEIIQSYLTEESDKHNLTSSHHLWKNYPPSVGGVTVNKFSRFADFIITGCTLHPEFDIEQVFNEIKYQIVWILFQQKSKHNIAISEKELEFFSEMAESTIKGNYSPNYRETRAIGLLIWDELHKNKDGTVTNIIKDIKSMGKMKSYQNSDERTIRRMYENAKKCIEEGKILPINSK